jgi:hydrogenase maturation protease
MSLVTVIGIGNRLFCDDGVGCEVVQTLLNQNTDRCINYLVGETDTSWCLSKITTPHIIIIDAVLAGHEAGSIHPISLMKCETYFQGGISMHNQHLLALLQVSDRPDGLLIGIEPFELSLYIGLSISMKSCFENIVKAAECMINNFIATHF